MQLKTSQINNIDNDHSVAYLTDDNKICLVNGNFIYDDDSKELILDQASTGTIILSLGEKVELVKINMEGFKGGLVSSDPTLFSNGYMTITKTKKESKSKTTTQVLKDVGKQTPNHINVKQFAV